MSSVPSISAEKYYGVKPADKKSGLDMQSFLKLLSVQMANQNPLEPMNDRDYFAQLAQLGQVQGMDKLTGQTELQQIQAIMGKEVTAVRPMSETGGAQDTVTGIATKMSVRNGEKFISLRQADGGTVEVKMANVQSVAEVPRAADYGALFGKNVEGIDAAGKTVAGKVAGISEEGGTVVLTLGSGAGAARLPIDGLRKIVE